MFLLFIIYCKITNHNNITAFIITDNSNVNNVYECIHSNILLLYLNYNMHRISMEAEDRNSIKYIMIIYNNNYIKNKNIVLIVIFTSIR